jgi:hypothetical protein
MGTVENSETITVLVGCPSCHEIRGINVPKMGYVAWQDGMHIQNALPQLSSSAREGLMSGYCGPCWDKDFPDE